MDKSSVIDSLRSESNAARALLGSLQDILDGDEEFRIDAIAGETDLMEAIDRATKRLLELDALMNGIVGLIANLKDRGDRLERQRDLIRESLAVAMEIAGRTKIETPIGTFSLRRVPPKVVPTDESLIPARFWKQPDPTLDKRALLAALKAGEDVPGATISNGSMTLSMKVD